MLDRPSGIFWPFSDASGRNGTEPLDSEAYKPTLAFMVIRLREWRERRGYSVRQLADRAAVTFSTIHRIEAGRISPTITMLSKLAAALDVRMRDLLPPEPQRKRRKRT